MTSNSTQSLSNSSTSENHENDYDRVESDVFREVFFFSSAIITLTGNFLVLFTLWKSPNMRKTRHLLIANLAAGDLCSGMVVLIFNTPTAQLHRWIFGDFLCTFSGFLLQMFSFQTIITLACVSIDRFYAICHALHYNVKMTRNKCRLMILLSWLYPVLSCSPPFYGWGHYKFTPRVISCMMLWGPHPTDISFSSFQGLTFNLSTGVIIFCYVKIWKEARKTFITNPLRTSQRGEPEGNSITNQIRKELQVAKKIIVMLAGFVITWMPFVICRIVQKWMPEHNVDGYTYLTTEKATLLMFTCSTFINPVIYSALDKQFRTQLKRVCSC